VLIIAFDPFPLLHTERLTLRPINAQDAEEILFLRSDPEVMKYIDKAPLQSAGEALLLIEKFETLRKAGEGINWGISTGDDEKLIGTICFWNLQPEHYRAEIGYTLHPASQGRGIMQEALNAVLSYGFRTMMLHSVEAHVNPGNAASIRLLEKNGFVREGYFRENFYWDGRFLDTGVYSLIAPAQ